MSNSQSSRLITFTFILSISTLLAFRPIGLGLDDDNYQEYLLGINELLSRYDGLNYIFNEPLWLFFCYAVKASLGVEGGLRFLIFASSLFAGLGLARINHWALLPIVLYFALPTSLKNHVDHLRQGFALGLYILLFSTVGRWRSLRFLTPFVHTSFWIAILIDILLISYFKNRPRPTRIDILKIMLFTASVSMAFSFGLEQLALYLGFRQADVYDFLTTEGTGAAFMGWLLLIPILLQITNLKYFGQFAAFLGFYLGGYFFSPVAARIFENSLFLLCSSAPIRSNNKGTIFWAVLILISTAFAMTGNLYPRLIGFSVQ